MPRRIHAEGTVPVDRVELGDGDWVELKRFMTLRDREAINEQMTHIDLGAGKGRVDVGVANALTLKRVLMAWGGPGFCIINHDQPDVHEHVENEGDCEPAPITLENISALGDDLARQLVERLRNREAVRPDPLPA